MVCTFSVQMSKETIGAVLLWWACKVSVGSWDAGTCPDMPCPQGKQGYPQMSRGFGILPRLARHRCRMPANDGQEAGDNIFAFFSYFHRVLSYAGFATMEVARWISKKSCLQNMTVKLTGPADYLKRCRKAPISVGSPMRSRWRWAAWPATSPT